MSEYTGLVGATIECLRDAAEDVSNLAELARQTGNETRRAQLAAMATRLSDLALEWARAASAQDHPSVPRRSPDPRWPSVHRI